MVKRVTTPLCLLVLLSACDKVDFRGFIVPTGDVVDSRFEQSAKLHNYEPIAHIEAGDSYLFYVSADPHISDSTENLDSFVADLRNDPAASFGIVLGDCIDRRGSMKLYADAIAPDDTTTPSAPIFSVLGNHDLYFSQWDEFRELIGPSVYWFEVEHPSGSDIFISLDSASGTLGIRQLEWLEGFLERHRSDYRHCVIITHTNILYTDNTQKASGNYPFEETMALLDLFDREDVLLCLQGHDHHREDLLFAGVRYTTLGTLRQESSHPEYLCIRITGEGMEYLWRDIR